MSDELDGIVKGAAGTGLVGLVLAFITGLFKRNVAAADTQLAQLSADVRQVLLELRTTTANLEALRDRINRIEASAAAAHRRLDEARLPRSTPE